MGTITILFVDQVGSTLQLSTLGDSSAVEIHDQVQTMVNEHLGRHHGVFHKHTGDGFMASFESCVDAVDCALSLQATTAASNADLPFERRVVLRMGLHTGEPLIHSSGPVGAAVVVAARLCDLAGAGQVLVSDVVRMLLEPRRTFLLMPVGSRRLKGFAEPMPCYLVRRHDQSSFLGMPPELDEARVAPFIGRAVELDRLRVAFVEAAEGTATALVVAGEPGAGKTRLVSEFSAEAHQQGARLLYASGSAVTDVLANELSSRRGPGDPAIVVADDVTDTATIREVVALLAAAPSSRVLAVVATTLNDLGDQIFGVPVVHLGGLSAHDIRYFLDVGGGPGDVEARARELVATAHGTPGAVRAELEELGETTIRGDLRVAIEQAMTVQEDEERSFAAITAGLLALRSDLPVGDGPGGGGSPPYKGLVAYGPDDGALFCGRDEVTAELVARATISRFIAVTGSSGGGKSSLVRAGLIASLRAGAISGSASWPIVSFAPHGRPLTELAEQLVTHAGGDSPSVLADRLMARPTLLADLATRLMEDRAGGSRLVIVVDQFEEVFTHCQNEQERTAFFDALVHAARVPDGPTTVVIVLRGDYYGHCSVHHELAQAVGASHLLIGPMSPSEVRMAVEEPARRASLTIDPELVDRAVDDASGEPGMLPLLSTAMLETWKRRHGNHLTLEAYVATGGVRGAIARLAESVYERLSPEQRVALRATLLRLAELGEDGDDVRRRAAIDELVTTPTHEEVLDVLVTHRLVTVDAGRAEVAHEALLREWPRLRTWLEEDRAGRRLHRQLTIDARAWEEAGRADDLLYRGVRLDAALEWSAGRADDLHPSERAFLDASRSAWQKELSASRRAARRFRWLAIALGLALLLALTAVVLFQLQRNSEADAQRRAEESATLTLLLVQSRGVQSENPALALALGAETLARIRDASPAATKALFDAGVAFAEGGLQQVGTPSVGHDGPVFGVAYSPDGATFASGGMDSTIRLWDASTREQLGEPLLGHGCNTNDECNVSSVIFSPDGRSLASAGDDGTVRLWDLATRRETASLPRGDTGRAFAVAFSPDGRRLASGGDGGSVHVWDVATGKPVSGVFRGHDTNAAVWAVAFSPDGNRLATAGGDRSVRLWDPATGEQVGEPLLGHADQVQGVAFNPDGSLLATSGSLADRTVRLWNPATGEQVGDPFIGHTLGVWGVAFDPTGSLLASASEDGTVRLWDVARRVEVGRPGLGHLKGAFGISFSPDGLTLVSAGADETVRMWAVKDPRRRVLGPHPGPVYGVGFSPDGALVATAGAQGTVQLWDAATGTRTGEPLAGHAPDMNVSAAVFSPDGQTLASASDDGTVRLWDPATGQPVAAELPFGVGAYGLAFAPDGSRMAAVGQEGKVVVWDTATWTPLAGPYTGHEGEVWSVAFNPDGTLLATGGSDGTARIWDVVSGEAVEVLPVEEGPVNVVRFSPDGEVLATGSDDGTVRLWDVSGGGLREELTGHDQGVLSLAFDPQSDVLVSGSTDQTVRLWETATGAPITSIAAHAGPVWSVALDPTRRLLASAGEDGLVRLWDWVVDAETACELAAPFVTATQMKEYLEPAGASATCPLP